MSISDKFQVLSRMILFLVGGSPCALAQLPMVDEPHHKMVFEDKDIRITELRIRPGDSTALHLHDKESVVVFFSDSRFSIANKGKLHAMDTVKPGDIIYRTYGDAPLEHTVYNHSDVELYCAVIEALGEVGRSSSPPCQESGVLVNKAWVSASPLNIEPGKSISLPASDCSRLLFLIAGSGNITGRPLRTLGEYIRVARGKSVTVRASNRNTCDMILLTIHR